MKPTLFLLAAGMGSRYGGLKQLDGLGPNGETIMDYSIYDAIQAGFGKIVWVIRKDFEEQFRTQILSKYEGVIPCELCFQGIDSLPEGYCDDFYGRDAFMSIGKYLSNLPEGAKNKYAMVGFRCCNTLSENGSVARGVCMYDDNRHLVDVVERTEILRQADKGNAICYKDEQGEWIPLAENVPVSMNMWGFTPDYFEYSEAEFKEFLSDPKNMENLKAEFFIPLMVNKLIKSGTATVEVLDTTSVWFGVTYAADREATVERIAKLVADGVYPNKLF